MKEVIRKMYICDKCGAEFFSKEECFQHETFPNDEEERIHREIEESKEYPGED